MVMITKNLAFYQAFISSNVKLFSLRPIVTTVTPEFLVIDLDQERTEKEIVEQLLALNAFRSQ